MTVNCSQWWCKKEYQMMRQKNIIGIIHKLIMCCVVHFVQKQQQQLRNEKYFPIKINEMAIFFFKDTLGCVRLLQDSNKQIFKSSAQYNVLILIFLTLSWLLFVGCFIPSVEWWLILFVISLEQAPKALLMVFLFFFTFSRFITFLFYLLTFH